MVCHAFERLCLPAVSTAIGATVCAGAFPACVLLDCFRGRRWWDGMFRRCFRWGCNRKRGTGSSRRRSWGLGFSSGGRSFNPGQVSRAGRDGRCFYIFFLPPCRATSSPDFLCSPTVSRIPMYFSMPRHFGLSVLEDQQCAAALMWTCVTVVYLVPAAILSTRLLSPRSFYPGDFPQSEVRGSDVTAWRSGELGGRLEMATEPILAALDVSAVQSRRIASSRVLFDFWELTKPEINFLIAITVGRWILAGLTRSACAFSVDVVHQCALGTVFVASGAATLNQLIELRYDAQMRRTARRPLASGRIAAFAGLVVRSFAVRLWCRVPCHFDERPCVSAGRTDPTQLFVFVYATKADHAPVHVGRRGPGRRTAVDRLGSSVRASRCLQLGRCSRLSSSGNSHISCPSRGCIAKTTRAQATSSCPRASSKTALLSGSAYCPPWAFS